MSFQDSAQSWRAKAHVSSVKPPMLIGVCALILCALFFVLNGLWNSLAIESFSIETEESSVHSLGDKADSQEKGDSGGGNPVFAVHIGGAVVSPGVYELEEGSRVQKAIEKAGGFTEFAAQDAINLARVINDGEQIVVPTIEEVSQTANAGDSSLQASQKVNINSASVAELTTLSGVGEATAKKIIADRETHGPFSSPEELMRVAGIGEKKYAQLADSICV